MKSEMVLPVTGMNVFVRLKDRPAAASAAASAAWWVEPNAM